ncbi:MAG: hypothetical protein KJP04_06950, partial [Arenicella sp.]|nr:hypothetical protein [Arenicella sp.]
MLLTLSLQLFALSGFGHAHAESQEDLQLPAPASPKKSIRFYKVNKQMQGDRVMLTPKKSSSPGCQNFLKSVRVHKAVQTGYIVCLVYAEKDCKHASMVEVAREEKPRRTYFLTEGFAWMPQSDDMRWVKLGSWNCGLELEAEHFAEEAMLAAAEVK